LRPITTSESQKPKAKGQKLRDFKACGFWPVAFQIDR
jgi:hypothetical protein